MGHLGRDRTFMVQPSKSMQKIPSDLAGVEIPAYEWPRADESHLEAMRPVCELIRAAIRTHGIAPAKRIDDLRMRQERTESDVPTLRVLFRAAVPV